MSTIEQSTDLEARVEAAVGAIAGHLTGAAVTSAIILGDELGLYAELAEGPITAGELSSRRSVNERLTREWLDGQSAAGIVAYDAEADTYRLLEEYAPILVDRDAPTYMAAGASVMRCNFMDLDGVVDAFRTDGAFPWGAHHECLFRGTGEFFRPGYRTFLVDDWIASLDGVTERLRAGGRVLDVGCGVGHSSVLIAEAFPATTVVGIDAHPGSIRLARENVAASTASERLDMRIGRADDYHGSYDLICFFDCLHDMGDPVGIARHALEQLAVGGTVLVVEPFAMDDREANQRENHFAPLAYIASTFFCTPNSLSQDVGRAMGAQSGEAGMRAVFEEAGYRHFRRAAETPFNIVYEARA
ncbi:MAG: class I SAM-dependent methyltransferase [Actinomycetota bacterium]|nr:class I SAM-dependent methyltransferase [Actinomycetota bacterium]